MEIETNQEQHHVIAYMRKQTWATSMIKKNLPLLIAEVRKVK